MAFLKNRLSDALQSINIEKWFTCHIKLIQNVHFNSFRFIMKQISTAWFYVTHIENSFFTSNIIGKEINCFFMKFSVCYVKTNKLLGSKANKTNMNTITFIGPENQITSAAYFLENRNYSWSKLCPGSTALTESLDSVTWNGSLFSHEIIYFIITYLGDEWWCHFISSI